MFKKALRDYTFSSRVLPALLVAIGISLGGYFVGNSIKMRQLFDRYVTVKGLAERTVKADEAGWQISFNYADDDLSKLYQGISHAQTAAEKFLETEGFKENEIELTPVSVTDNQSSSYNTNEKVKRYTATAGLNIQTENVDLVKRVVQALGKLVEQGVIVSSSTVAYHFTHLNKIKPEMLVEAAKNAKKAAEIFAKNSNSRLCGIRQASQGQFSIESATGSPYDETGVMKKVRVVTTIGYFLK